MGCGGSKSGGETGEPTDEVDMRKTSVVGGYGMDFFGEMNSELVSRIQSMHKAMSYFIYLSHVYCSA